MESLQFLIGKLKEQFEQKAPPMAMLATVKQMEAELAALSSPSKSAVKSTKVAVVMPSSLKYIASREEIVEVEPAETEMRIVEKEEVTHPTKKSGSRDWILDPLQEIPTLSHQQGVKEINDVMGSNGSSLNDKLKGDVVELAAALKEAPVRELKKAIGVNDRYVFINELFRGDEPMYERSIKTINNFRILPEAEYWMERELKIKLGWDDSREITRHFYQLVRRRFS
jgi:hypothetical protein